MYEWILDGISSLFVPFSGGKSTTWPSTRNGDLPSPAAATEEQRQENSNRPAKRNYQSVHSPEGKTEDLDIKRPRRDVIFSVVKKTVAGVAGLFRLRHPQSTNHDNRRPYMGTQVHPVALMGIDEIQSNNLNTWMRRSDVKMEKPREAGFPGKERIITNFHQNPQPLIRKHDGAVLCLANQERAKDWSHRRSLQLLPNHPAMGVGTAPSDLDPPSMPPPSRSHKPCLTVEEALKESDRDHYRKLVEMASEKYSNHKPLPFGRMKPPIRSFALNMHKPSMFGRSCDISSTKPGPLRAAPSVSVWRDASSATQTKDRIVDVGLSKLLCDVRNGGLDGQPLRKGTTQPLDLDLSAEVATRLNLRDREPMTHTQPTVQARPEARDEEFYRLTKEMQQEVTAALAQRDPNLVLSSAFKLRITQRDLATLQEGSWLNDEVINFYLNLVMSRSEQEVGGRKVYSFSTFFFPKLHGGGHAAMRRWTKAVDLFLYDIILVPLHLGIHWSLAVVDLKSKSVRSYDSMGQRHDDICNLLLLYLKEEYKVKKSKDLDLSKWTVASLKSSEVPQQKNGSDCGVFACKYADYIARGRPFTFRQCNMPCFRKMMIWEILNHRLL